MLGTHNHDVLLLLLTTRVNTGVEPPPQKVLHINLSYDDNLPILFCHDSILINTALREVKIHSEHWIDLTTNPPIQTIRESLSQSNLMATRSQQHRLGQKWLCQNENKQRALSTYRLQRIGYRGRRMKKEQMMLQPTARKQGHNGKKNEERVICGRLGRTNYARAIKYPMYKYARWQGEKTWWTP